MILKQLRISDVSGLLERMNLFQDEIVDLSLEAGTGRRHEHSLWPEKTKIAVGANHRTAGVLKEYARAISARVGATPTEYRAQLGS